MIASPDPNCITRAVVYLRVSSDDQKQTGNGISAQFDACERFARSNGLQIVAEFRDEAICGENSIENRPGLMDAIAELQPGTVLLVAKRDRLARGDVMLMAMIEAGVKRKKARIVSAAGEGTEGDDPSQVLMRRLVDAFAEYEIYMIRARTKAALQAKKSRMEVYGPLPYGYEADTSDCDACRRGRPLSEPGHKHYLQMRPGFDQILDRIRAEKARGCSLREIAEGLNADEIPSPHTLLRPTDSKQWSHSGVASVLKTDLSIRGVQKVNDQIKAANTK